MILKFNILKLKLKLFFLRITGATNPNIPIVNLNQKGHNSKHILIIFPSDESEYRVAINTFSEILNNDSSCSFYFVVNNFEYQLHKFINSNTIHLDYNKNFIKDIPFSSINILEKEFDMIVDLNTKFNYNCSKLVNCIASKIKIGFKSRFSDLFYNIQFDASSANIIENAYKKIHSMVVPI